jgi:hypothetical protein
MTCNFNVYCEDGILKGDGLCFAECCINGNICDTCDKIIATYYSEDTRAKIIVSANYFSPALYCPTPPDLGLGGSWECVDIGGYTITERRCTYTSEECLCEINEELIQELTDLIEGSCPDAFGIGIARIDEFGLDTCCIGCCKPSNGDPPFPSTESDCARDANDQSAEWGPCGCIDGEFIDGGCNYTEPGGEKIGGCCYKSDIEIYLENEVCGGITSLSECGNEIKIGLNKACDQNSEIININSNFPEICEVDYPTSSTVDPKSITNLPPPSSECCSFECCSVVCVKNTASLIRKRIIGNKLRIKLNKAELIRRIRNKIKIRKTK